MKTAVRLTRLRDGSRLLSFSMHILEEELSEASKAVDAEHFSLKSVMDYAREGNLDGFLCFLRILWAEIRK